MKRTLYLAMILVIGLCMALPAASFAKSNRSGGQGYSMDRSRDRQDYRQERDMSRHRYRYEQQEMPKERNRQQIRKEAPEKDQLRKQVRDPSTHLPGAGTEVPVPE